jgi:hypothetical protein
MSDTYFLDIDGTLLEHISDFENITKYESLRALPDVSKKTALWHCLGHYIVLTTARCESLRELTVKQLHNAGIFYDHLLMGLGAGNRILVNDYVEGKPHKAWAYNVVRNIDGLSNVN